MRSRKSTRKIKTQIIQSPQILEHIPQTQSFFNIYGMKIYRNGPNDLLSSTEKQDLKLFHKSPLNIYSVLKQNDNSLPNSEKQSPIILLRKQKTQGIFKSPKSEKNISLSYNNKFQKEVTTSIIEQQEYKSILMKLQITKNIDTNQQKQLINKPFFRKLLKQYVEKFENYTLETDKLKEKIEKYEKYFQKIKLHNIQLPTHDNQRENMNLKCLLQQQKITSLLYIIKQYRQRNKDQTNKFQKMLLEYQPNIQNELTLKLAEANEKLEQTLKELNSIRELYQKYKFREGIDYDWKSLIIQIKDLKKQNLKISIENEELKKNISSMKQQFNSGKKFNDILNQLRQQLKHQKVCNAQNKLNLTRYQEENKNLETQLEQSKHKIDQLAFELVEKKNLQVKLNEKLRNLNQANQIISKLQNQNLQHKMKIESMIQQFQKRIFQEKTLIQKLNTLTANISDLKNKIIENLKFETVFKQKLNDNLEITELFLQKTTYIKHLFEKNQQLYNTMINQFKVQLNVLHNEAQNSRKVCNQLSTEQRQLISKKNIIQQEINTSKQKFNKYSKQIDKISIKNCIVCNELVGYCNQINLIFSKLFQTINEE